MQPADGTGCENWTERSKFSGLATKGGYSLCVMRIRDYAMSENGRLTTHVLDTMRGVPAVGLGIDLASVDGGHAHLLQSFVTNADGRCDKPLLEGDDMLAGTYELLFNVGAYFAKLDVAMDKPFLDIVPVRFVISEPQAHYHVPLLLSPYGYSTYRGS
jgi:5-hydroxyisourate hydrolase